MSASIDIASRCRLVLGDCREAPRLAPDLRGSVALVVTSPPYHNAIDYDVHALDASRDYRTRARASYPDTYLPLLQQAWASCWQMLRPGGYLAVNVGSVLLDGYHYPLPQDVLAQLASADPKWDYVRTIAWNKVTAGVKRAGSVIQKRLPGYWYPNIMTEHIIVVRKPGPAIRVRHSEVPREWWQPVWDLAPVPPRSVPHPAPFPEDLPHRLVRMLTVADDVVMDPFNGAGATTKAAVDLGRRGLGFDLEPKYIEYAERRIAMPSAVRSVQLQVRPAGAGNFTSPPSRGRTRHGAGHAARAKRPRV